MPATRTNESTEVTNFSEKPVEFKPKTQNDIEREKKRRRTEAIVGAIGDGLTSLTNLFFTTKGAPSIINGDVENKKVKATPTILSSIIERHKNEDEDYSKKYSIWEKQQREIAKQNESRRKQEEKEAEKNRRYELANNFGIKECNWGNLDFINQLYNGILEWNQDPKLREALDSFQYKYEPIWEWLGRNWSHTEGHDKKIDQFKGKTGTYLKRDLIEAIFGYDESTTTENRQHLIDCITEFENLWIPIK